MEWSTNSIPIAINEAKTNKSIFAVYIFGGLLCDSNNVIVIILLTCLVTCGCLAARL